MNLTALLIFLVGPVAFLQAPKGSPCVCVASNESTRAGANENVILVEKVAYHQLKGVVRAGGGQILSDVLVEVLDQPDYLLLKYPESEKRKKGQRRLAACVVGADGRFCFRGLPPGKYELRFSKDGGWNHTQVYVVIAAANQKASRRSLELSMQVGT